MTALDPEILTLVTLITAGLCIVLLVTIAVLLVRVRSLTRAQRRAFDVEGDDVVTVLGRHSTDLAAIHDDLAQVHTDTAHLRELLRTTVSRVAVVRYDAFEDMGGALSFSAALLDEQGTGVVLSAINGRTETRSYAKAIVEGGSEHNLSSEELAAIDNARNRRPAATVSTGGRRRRRAS